MRKQTSRDASDNRIATVAERDKLLHAENERHIKITRDIWARWHSGQIPPNPTILSRIGRKP